MRWGGNGSAADLVFVNGAVYTVDATRCWAQAVAVRDGRIALVGTDDDVRAAVGGGTEVIDLAGRMLVPGFQDAHVHPIAAGIDMLQCDLHDLDSKAGYLAAIAAYAEANPDEQWILGGGWSMDVFPRGCPSKDDLDPIVPDRPVFLPNRDGHSAWVNSVALERAVSSVTSDPGDGRIERTADGEPSGTLHEARCSSSGISGSPFATGRRRRSGGGAGVPARARHHRVAGRDRRGRVRRLDGLVRGLRGCGRGGNVDGARRRRALVGPARGTRADRQPRRAPGARRDRTLRRHLGEDHAGRRLRELHGSRPGPVPGCERRGDGQPGDLVRRAGSPQGGGDPARCVGVPGPFPRPGGPSGPGGARCRGGGPADQRADRHPSAPRPPPDRASGRPPTVPVPRRGRERATALGGARDADGRAHDPVPGRAPMDVAVPVRQPRPERCDARDGERLVRVEPQPLWRCRSPSNGEGRTRPPRRSARASPRCSSPRSGSTSPRPSAPSPWGRPT